VKGSVVSSLASISRRARWGLVLLGLAVRPALAQPAAPPEPAGAVARADVQAPAAPPAPVQDAPQPAGQAPLPPAVLCGQQAPPPARLPPPGSGPVVYLLGACFPTQGGASVIDPQTYLYYIHLRPSRPSADVWVPYDEKAEETILEDFRRLWNTNFLDNLWVEVTDYQFPNGVIGKLVAYNLEERQRVKIVDYVGSKHVEVSKIEEKLREKNAVIRLDSFIDPGLVRRVAGIVRELYAEKGYQYAEVKPRIREVAGGPKLVHLSFLITEGPKVRIRRVDFAGNRAVSDRALRRQLKENKPQWLLSFITGRGTYQEAKFADDAEKIVEYYRDKGYIQAQVGNPELKVLEDSTDGRTRWVELRIPVQEGERYRIGDVAVAGNDVVKTEALRALFKLKPGKFYSEKQVRKGFEKAREVYGAAGFFEFTGYPDLVPRDPGKATEGKPAVVAGAPVVDVTLRMQEGKQYFVNRITFVGNTTTHDTVIRREMRLYEGGIFNTEALKYSIRRLNQLGYFKQLEGDAIKVDKTPNQDNKVDVTLKLEEQNRNQITFGAGVSQWEGFFGQLSFQTANFLGRGETFSIVVQAGARAKNYQLAFTEPFLFDRNITGGIDVYNRELRYIGQFTEASRGGNLMFGFPVSDFGRVFTTYSYDEARIKDLDPLYQQYLQPGLANPFLYDALLIGQGGRRTVSKVTPSYVFNTVDQPIFPSTGRRLTAAMDIAGLGGNTNFLKPRLEAVWYLQQTRRLSLGLRALVEYLRPYGRTTSVPIFERLWLGGEYSIRGFDIRTIGPRDPASGFVIGGNKSLLFNAEYMFNIGGPVRLVAFYDAGQVRDFGERFGFKEPIREVVQPQTAGPVLFDPFATVTLRDPLAAPVAPQTVIVGYRSAFKTSTGLEVRFFMPVLNVPFRLIFAYNPQRGGIFDNNGQPQKPFTFRFAVGTTF
jgi:outer membrane protein insertion porin family